MLVVNILYSIPVRYACSPSGPSGCVAACVVYTADSIRTKKNDSQVPNFWHLYVDHLVTVYTRKRSYNSQIDSIGISLCKKTCCIFCKNVRPSHNFRSFTINSFYTLSEFRRQPSQLRIHNITCRSKQRRRAIEALEVRAPPQTVWRLWLIVYRT